MQLYSAPRCNERGGADGWREEGGLEIMIGSDQLVVVLPPVTKSTVCFSVRWTKKLEMDEKASRQIILTMTN